ncbi:MAG: hypothetical protein E7549_06560 [Ruminococcaceae bacterium]|nr:hypothetical protein [Oscillospiraceae bacterium]
MKKIATILLVLALTFSFTGCKNNISVDKMYFKSINYNNYYNFRSSCDLWINDDMCLYNSDGFYNMRTFAYQNGSKVKLFESNDFINETYYGEVFPINDFAYFITSTDANDQNFYKFSFANQNYEKLFTTSNCSEWMGTLDYIAFSEYRNEEQTTADLFIYNINKDTSTSICNGILNFGIVNNKTRYLTWLNTDTLVLFEYDHTDDKSNKIGEISVKIKDEFPIYNFTNDYTTIAQYDSDDYKKITVYSSDGSSCEYSLPKSVQQFVAGEHFAYAVCYETEEYSSTAVEHKDNGIYRINLADGSYELVETIANKDTEIHVVSDDEIYITQYEMNFIGQYKGHVYKLIVPDKTKTKIFVI